MLFTVKSAKVWQWEFRMCSCAHQASFDSKYLTLCVRTCVSLGICCYCECACVYICSACVCAHAPVSMTVTVLEAVPSVREILAFSMSLA